MVTDNGKAWGNPCRRGHVNEDGKTLRYRRRNKSGELEDGNCVECNREQRPKWLEWRRERYATDAEWAERERAKSRRRMNALTAAGHTRASSSSVR